MSTRNEVLATIEIRWPEAVWVLGAHAYALLIPLTLCAAVHAHYDFLLATTYKPYLFYIAAGLLTAGSAFEVAQNAFDRWYLTGETASANGTGFSDFLFYWLVTAGQALCAVAIGGDTWWVLLIALSAIAVFPVCYIKQVGHFAPLSVVSLLTVSLAYQAFGDPVIFLQLLLAGVTMYFFAALLKTGAQVIHGLTTLAASSGVWFFVWALHSAAAGVTHSWLLVLTIASGTAILGTALWPLLTRLPASPRVVHDEVGGALAS
jgi:hypothetical protein